MEPKAFVVLIVSLLGVCVAILGLQNLVAGEWTTIAQNLTLAVIAIAIIGVIMLIIYRR